MKYEEKFENEQVLQIFQFVVDKLIQTQKEFPDVRQTFWNAKASIVSLAVSDNVTIEKFHEEVQKLKCDYGIEVYLGLSNIYNRNDEQGTISISKNNGRNSIGITVTHVQDDNLTKIKTKKWNPMTYALHKQNVPLIKLLVTNTNCYLKKLMKIPNLAGTNYINKLFPFQN